MAELFSPYLIAIVAAWLLSHVVKYIIAIIRGKQLPFVQQLFASGGMPSSHTATVFSVWTIILLIDGVGSGLFGLATALVLIVTYDAAKSRRSTGEQGDALTALLASLKSRIKPPRTAKGHTPLEVVVGALFGIGVALAVFFLTK